MKYKYKKLSTGSVRPIIPITIKSHSDEVDYFALIDSGADLCIFPGEIGEFLGLDVTSGRKEMISGVVEGEKREYFLHKVELKVGGWPYEAEVGFMPELSRLGYGLLGQRGFFDQFKSVKFEKPKDTIELTTI